MYKFRKIGTNTMPYTVSTKNVKKSIYFQVSCTIHTVSPQWVLNDNLQQTMNFPDSSLVTYCTSMLQHYHCSNALRH